MVANPYQPLESADADTADPRRPFFQSKRGVSTFAFLGFFAHGLASLLMVRFAWNAPPSTHVAQAMSLAAVALFFAGIVLFLIGLRILNAMQRNRLSLNTSQRHARAIENRIAPNASDAMDEDRN